MSYFYSDNGRSYFLDENGVIWTMRDGSWVVDIDNPTKKSTMTIKKINSISTDKNNYLTIKYLNEKDLEMGLSQVPNLRGTWMASGPGGHKCIVRIMRAVLHPPSWDSSTPVVVWKGVSKVRDNNKYVIKSFDIDSTGNDLMQRGEITLQKQLFMRPCKFVFPLVGVIPKLNKTPKPTTTTISNTRFYGNDPPPIQNADPFTDRLRRLQLQAQQRAAEAAAQQQLDWRPQNLYANANPVPPPQMNFEVIDDILQQAAEEDDD